MIAVFVWTFSGICDAIALAIVAIIFLYIGVLFGLAKIETWWHGLKKK